MGRGAARALLLLLAIAAPAAASDDAVEWLDRMRDALAGLDYQGTVVAFRDGQLDAMRLVHRTGPGGLHESLVALTGAPRVLRRDGAGSELQDGDRRLPVGNLLPALPDADRVALQRYDAVLAGADRVAGMPTRVIEIRPRDEYRYGYRLWLENEHGFPLKSVAFAADGRAVEQWMFAEIEFGAAASAGKGGRGAVAAAKATGRSSAATPRTRWQVSGLPPGFSLVALVESDGDGEHQLYSDGLARVSLYVEPLADRTPNLSGLLRRGSTSVFGRVLQDRQITVVGQVPPVTVERFAHGVEPLHER